MVTPTPDSRLSPRRAARVAPRRSRVALASCLCLSLLGTALSLPALGEEAGAPLRLAQNRSQPIDGTWRLIGEGQRIRIHNGRSFDGRTGQPLGREIVETGRGSYSLFDLKCECQATMSLTAGGRLSGVSHTADGAVPWELEPIRLQDPAWFEELVLGLG